MKAIGPGYERTKKQQYDKIWFQNRRIRARSKILFTLGSKCKRCGFSDSRALQVDHINGGGSIHRNTGNYEGRSANGLWNAIKRNFFDFQLLCANCNWIKRVELREYRKYES